MGVELGRISGPLLTANLLRHGTDLAFETDLVYISVEDLASPSKIVGIGVNTDAPNRPLTVNGTTSTTNTIVDTAVSTPEFYISSNRIQSTTGIIYIAPYADPDPLLANPTIATARIGAGDLRFSTGTIGNITTDSDIILSADGTGKIVFTTNRLTVANNLHSTGNITLDGNIVFGSDDEDSVTFTSDIASNLVPDQTATYNIGSETKRWNHLHVKTVDSDFLQAPSVTLPNVDLLLTQGHTYYVSVNGLDTNVGNHLHNTFKTIKHALGVASAGDEVVVFPGTYTEQFPLTVPTGVTVKGTGIRSVTIEPTIASNNSDCFLLNGGTTVGFLTVQGFYSPGYAFKLAPGYLFSNKSPYIYNVSVITRGSVITLEDPLGFDQGDAGGGAYIDGAAAASTVSNGGAAGTVSFGDPIDGGDAVVTGVELSGGDAATGTSVPSMLFYSTTFIVPNAPGLVATNRARVEWLNSFTYFAHTGIRLQTGVSGLAGAGQTRITVTGVTGPVEIGATFAYLSNDSLTIIATGIVSAVNGNQYTLDGFVGNMVTIEELQPTAFISINNAALSTSQFKFGTASLALTGQNYISGPDSFKYNLASNNFCIESWIYPTVFPSGDATIIAHWGATAQEQSFNMQLTADGGLKLLLNDSQNTVLQTGIEFLLSENAVPISDELGNEIISENSAIVLSSWQHVAAVKYGNVLTLYVNGVKKISTILPTDHIIVNAIGDLTIGHSSPSTVYFTGYIDEVRISNDTARFTAEFVPPTVAYVSDNDTALLLHFDGVDGSEFFIDDSDVLQNIVFTNVTNVFLNQANGGSAGTEVFARNPDGGDAFTGGGGLSGGNAATGTNATARAITAIDHSDFAAEMRSINSANVYGTFGAVADGRDTLAYLVGHNFGYIGTGAYSDNDPARVIQANEVVESNYGTIFYDSVDHRGDFRVGDIFYVNQQTGQVTFDAQALDFSAGGNIVLEGAASTTVINAYYVETGNLRLFDNTVASLSGSVDFLSFNQQTNLLNDVAVSGNLQITNNLAVAGDIYLGDNILDTITIVSALTQSLLPNSLNLNIGSDSERWDVLYANLLDVNDVLQLDDAVVAVQTANTDLRLTPAANGSVVVTADLAVSENVTVGGDVSVLGLTTFKLLEIDGQVSVTGDIGQTAGNLELVGNLSTGNLQITGDSYFYAPDIKIYRNVISVETTNEDLVITANGTGGVIFDNTLKITNAVISVVTATGFVNLSDGGTAGTVSFGDPIDGGDAFVTGPEISGGVAGTDANATGFVNLSNGGTAGTVSFADPIDGGTAFVTGLEISGGVADTDSTANNSIILQPNGLGNLTIDSNKALEIPSGSSVDRTLISNGEIRFNTEFNSYEGFSNTGAVPLNNVTSVARTTVITSESTVGADTDTVSFTADSIVRSFITSSRLFSNSVTVDTISIANNTISSSIDLQFVNQGSGSTVVNDVKVKSSTITNSKDTAFVLGSTVNSVGAGYVKFGGRGAVIFPYGPTADRRSSPEIGELRNNSTLAYMEVFSGTDWIPAVGTQGAATQEQIEETLNLFALVMG